MNMCKSTRAWHQAARLPLAVAVTAAVLSTQAQAINFDLMNNEIQVSFDSDISYGVSWSAAGNNKKFIGANNGGEGQSQTTDDNDLNYDSGDKFSEVVKGIHDLEVVYGDSGMFVRGKYWYDFEQREDTDFKPISDKGRHMTARTKGSKILDAYLWHNYEALGQPGSVRLGEQVVSWGESTFIQNGINAINPFDVSAFRKPGAEIKEGLTPTGMVFLQQGLTENVSFEAFAQYEWEPTTIDNCGTFFSTNDIAALGCNDNLAVLSQLTDGQLAAANFVISQVGAGLAPGEDLTITQSDYGEGVIVGRAKNDEPGWDGQWGTALRWYAAELNDTEFGFYFMNYHSKTPVLTGVGATDGAYATASTITSQGLGLLAGGNPAGAALVGIGHSAVAGNSQYKMEYAEDVRLYGLSFASTLGTTALSGEISYRPNDPVALNTTDVLFAGLASEDYVGGAFSNYSAIKYGKAGEDVQGYVRQEVTQAQVTALHFFEQVMGAERWALVGEVGANWVSSIDDSDLRYGRDPVFGPGPSDDGATCNQLAASLSGGQSNYCEKDGFADDFSWGYRMRASGFYNDVFAGINMTPSISWQHDVEGYSTNSNFIENRKAVSMELRADYLNTYNASVSFTDYFDGKYSTQTNQDFISANVGMTF